MDLIDLSDTGDNDSRFDEFLHRIRADLGFDEATFAVVSPSAGTIIGFSTYPKAWRERYAKSGYHMTDPALRMTLRSVCVVDWERLTECCEYDEVFSQAREAGVPERGVTIPVRGPFGEWGILSVAANMSKGEWEARKARHMRELQRRAVHLFDMVQGSKKLAGLLTRHSLSKIEIEILRYSAEGRSQAEIAAKMTKSERTVGVYIGSIKTKLCALNMPQAVGKAMQRGVIEA